MSCDRENDKVDHVLICCSRTLRFLRLYSSDRARKRRPVVVSFLFAEADMRHWSKRSYCDGNLILSNHASSEKRDVLFSGSLLLTHVPMRASCSGIGPPSPVFLLKISF